MENHLSIPFAQRLRQGHAGTGAALATRLAGLLLLAGAARLIVVEHARAVLPVGHDPSAGDLMLCALIIALLCAGLTLAMQGARVFAQVPLPPHFTRSSRHGD